MQNAQPKTSASPKQLTSKQGLLVGITLFSMFFGAGNLILAPLMGVQAGTSTPLALAGFLISAVGFPVLCIAALALAGSARQLMDRIHPLYSKVFMVLVYLSIGPCLAIPRTASTSYSMIEPLIAPLLATGHSDVARLVFSVAFFALVFVLALRPGRLTQILGKISGPVLIALIVVVVGSMVLFPPVVQVGVADASYAQQPLVAGFITGYQTMDVLAAFAFGIVIAMNIKEMGVSEPRAIAAQVMRSGVFVGVLLALIYVGFGYLGLLMGPTQASGSFTNGAQVISAAAALQFGWMGVAVVAVIFFLACLNVCIALVCSISEYFAENFSRFSYKHYVVATVLVGMVLANVGLTNILIYSVPILMALYPPSLTFVVMGLLLKHADKHPLTWKLTLGVCSLLSVCVAVRDGFAPTLALPFDVLPLASLGLGWIVPTVVAWIVGVCVEKVLVNRA